jgi:hypothetical protein
MTLHKVALAFDHQLVIPFDVPVASASRDRVALAER